MADCKCWICRKSSSSSECSWVDVFVPPDGAVLRDGKILECKDFEIDGNSKLWKSPERGVHVRLLVKECENCGKRMTTYDPKRRFCCRDCYYEYISKSGRGKCYNFEKKIRKCGICRHEFAAHGKEKYCSDECRAEANKRAQKAYRERHKK